jgi:hypothetical protein
MHNALSLYSSCDLPEGLLALEDILVALLALLGTEANVVGLFQLAGSVCLIIKYQDGHKLTMKSLLSFNVMVPSKSVKKMNLGSLKGNLSALRSIVAMVTDLRKIWVYNVCNSFGVKICLYLQE